MQMPLATVKDGLSARAFVPIVRTDPLTERESYEPKETYLESHSRLALSTGWR